jgi:hypothetical protein
MNLDKSIYIEVIGVDPPCRLCHATWNNVQKAVSTVQSEGIEATMKRLDITSRDVIRRYGPLVSPAIIVNGTVGIMGRVPDPNEIATVLRETAK